MGAAELSDEALRRLLIQRGALEATPHLDAALRGAGDALSLGYGDELQGELAAFGHTGADAQSRRRNATEASRRRLREAQTDRPVSTFAGGAVTALIPGTLALRGARAVGGASSLARQLATARSAGNIAQAAQLAPRAAQAGRQALYGSSAAQGAVWGSGTGETPEGRLVGAGVGTVAGLGGAALGETVGGIAASARGLRDPVVRAERMMAREVSESVPTEQDLVRRLVRSRFNPIGLTPSAARAEARRMIQDGRAGRFEPEDIVRRARYAHNRANEPTMMEMIPRASRTARAINAAGGPGEGIIGRALDQQRATFGRDVAQQAERTLRPRGAGPGGGGRSRTRGAGASIDKQPPPTGLQEFNERLGVAQQAQNRDAYAAAYRTQLTPAQQAAAGRRMTGGAFKQRARQAAIDRADEDIARLADDLDNFQTSGASNQQIQSAAEELADVQAARIALEALDGATPSTTALNARAIDLYQRGLRHLADDAGGGATEGGRNIAAVRRTFMDNLRTVSPELHSAISGARGFHALREARELGQSLFRPGREAEIDTLLRRAMTTDEQDAFMVGALDAIEARLAANELTAVRGLQRNQNWRALVARSARSERAGQRFLDLIDDKVAQADRANFVRGGSPTAPIQEDIRRLTQEGDLSFIQDVVQAGGDVKAPALRRLSEFADRHILRPGIRNPQVQSEMARMLTQPGTMANAQTLATRLQLAPKASIFTPEGQRGVSQFARAGSAAAQEGANSNPAIAEMTGIPGAARGVEHVAQGRPVAGAQELAYAGLGFVPFIRGGRIALGATAGLGATAVGAGVAQAQENSEQRRDALRAEITTTQESLRQIDERLELLQNVDASNPESVAAAQRILGVRVDGRMGPETRPAIAQRVRELRGDKETVSARLSELEQTDAVQRLSPSPEEEARREAMLGLSAAGGALLGKYGLPIPRSVPGIGRLSGALGRTGTARGVERQLADQTARANAIQFPSTPLGRRSAANDAQASARAARVNEFWSIGGAGERVPFRVGAGQRPDIRPRSVEAQRLFNPPRFSGEDFGYMGIGALDAGAAAAMLPEAQRNLEEASRAYRDRPTEANLVRVEQARETVTRLEIMGRIGAGYVGGRVLGGYTQGYNRLPRPGFSAAQAEQGRVARYVAPSQSRSRPPPQR